MEEHYFIRLRKARLRSGLSEAEVASRIGVKPRDYEEIEKGTVKASLDARRKIEAFVSEA